jgi:CHAT domain-containing protein
MEIISPKILHIATHGFFQPSCQTTTKKWDSYFRSGFVLAGVNSYICGQPFPAEVGNGIITAYEISGLNLVSTDLVVLSACETGIGDIIFCEGVYGFLRAFAIAGAQALVLSLWSIPDEETKDLMVIFYSLLKSGKSKSEAMREAQLALKKKYPHPYFWGAFILQGDASPIQW